MGEGLFRWDSILKYHSFLASEAHIRIFVMRSPIGRATKSEDFQQGQHCHSDLYWRRKKLAEDH